MQFNITPFGVLLAIKSAVADHLREARTVLVGYVFFKNTNKEYFNVTVAPVALFNQTNPILSLKILSPVYLLLCMDVFYSVLNKH